MQKRIISQSESSTRDVAEQLLKTYLPRAAQGGRPLVIMLYGDLGAGKTVFVKEIGKNLGVNEIVSPAFVVYYEYPIAVEGWKYLYHFDLYRITESTEFDHLGINELLVPGNILAIEWSEKSGPVKEMMYNKGLVVSVQIEHKTGDTRVITVEGPEL